MKGKNVIIILTVVLSIMVPASVFAGTSGSAAGKAIQGFFGIDTTKLTDKQRADITDYSKKMAELQKEFINKMISNGSITKEQGSNTINKIDAALKEGKFPVPMLGSKHFEKNRGKFGFFEIDPSRLNDKQKADLMESKIKLCNLQRELVQREVEVGLITKEQGDKITQKLETAIKKENIPLGAMKKGFGGAMLFRFDAAKLSDKQKSVLIDYANKLGTLQKELISKAVTNGSITKEKGDKAIERINERLKNPLKNHNHMGKDSFGKNRKSMENNMTNESSEAM